MTAMLGNIQTFKFLFGYPQSDCGLKNFKQDRYLLIFESIKRANVELWLKLSKYVYILASYAFYCARMPGCICVQL